MLENNKTSIWSTRWLPRLLLLSFLGGFFLGCDRPAPRADMPEVKPAPDLVASESKPRPEFPENSPEEDANSLPKQPVDDSLSSLPEEGKAGNIVGEFSVPLAGGYRPATRQVSPLMADLFTQARTAMAHRDMVTASGLLRLSPPNDPGASDALELERLWLLSRLLVKFWSGVREATGTLAVGTRLIVADVEATITSVEGGEVGLKFANNTEKRQPLSPMVMPAELAEALARRGLAATGPVVDRMVVSFHLLDRQGDPERAALLCRRLDLAGLNIDLFLPEM